MDSKSTVINGVEVDYYVDLMAYGHRDVYEICFTVNGVLFRETNKQLPAVGRWILKQFAETVRLAEKNNAVVFCTAYKDDADVSLRQKAYAKYLTQLDEFTFAVGVKTLEELNSLLENF